MTDDQKRMLGFAGVGAAAFLIYRRMHSGATATQANPVNSTATGSIAPYTPQTPLPLQPGESVYDPNSEDLLTTPTGFPTSPAGGTAVQTAAPSAPFYAVNVTYPSTVRTVKQTVKPTKRAPAKKAPKKPAKKKAA